MTPATVHLYETYFQRRLLETFLLDGEPVWSAGLLGDSLGYAHLGTRLCTLIRTDWCDDFVEGVEMHYLTGERLAAFKRAVHPCHSVAPQAAHLLLLTARGVDRVLLKSDKPVRVAFRKHFERELLPDALAAADEARGAAPPTAPARLPEPTPAPTPVSEPARPSGPDRPAGLVLLHAIVPRPATATRERRLWAQLGLRARIFRSNALRETVRVLHALDLVDDATRAAYEVRAAEIALDEDLPALRPPVAERWYSAGDIARSAGTTPEVINEIISALGIRGAAGVSRQVITTTLRDGKSMFSFVYNDDGRALILAACGAPIPPGRAA